MMKGDADEDPTSRKGTGGIRVLLGMILLLSLFSCAILPVVAEDAGSLNAEGDLLLSHLQYENALVKFQQALSIDPGSIGARTGMSIALLRLQRYQDAVLSFDIAIERDPGNAELWMYRGDALAGAGKTEMVISSYQNAVSINPALRDAWVRLGDSLAKANRWDEAIGAWRQGAELRPGDVKLQKKIENAVSEHGSSGLLVPVLAIIILGIVAGTAILLWRKRRDSPPRPAEDSPGSGRPKKWSAWFREHKMESVSPAKSSPQDRATKDPARTTSRMKALRAGLIAKGTKKRTPRPSGEKSPAGTSQADAVPAGPLAMEGEEFSSAGVSPDGADQGGSPETIAAGFNRLLSGTEAEPAGFRGIAMYSMGRYREALEEFDREIAKGRATAGIWTLRGAALSHVGRADEALASCEHAIASGQVSFQTLHHYGDLLASSGNNSKALHVYDRALSVNPNSAKVWASRGRILQDLGRHEEALQSYEKALATGPDSPGLRLQQARVLMHLGQYEDALNALDRGLVQAPDDHSLLLSRIWVLNHMDNKSGEHPPSRNTGGTSPDVKEVEDNEDPESPPRGTIENASLISRRLAHHTTEDQSAHAGTPERGVFRISSQKGSDGEGAPL